MESQRVLFGGFPLVWGLRFVQRILTLRCAVIAVFTGKVNKYFALFFASGYSLFRNQEFLGKTRLFTTFLRQLWSEVLKNFEKVITHICADSRRFVITD